MQSRPFALRAVRTLALAGALATLAGACGDDGGEDPEPQVARVTLSVTGGASAQTLTWNTDDNTVTGGPIVIGTGQTRTITATQFLRADGTPETLVTASEFRLDVNETGDAVTVAASGTSGLARVLTAAGPGATGTITVELFHLGEGHREYGPSTAITVNVQ